MQNRVAHLGRRKKGDRLRLVAGTFGSTMSEETADAAPEYQVIHMGDATDAMALIEAATKMALVPERTDSYLFSTDFTIDDDYVVGQYLVIVNWEVSSVKRYVFSTFEVVDGDGDRRGTFVNMFSYDQFSGWHVVGQTSEGIVEFGRRPT